MLSTLLVPVDGSDLALCSLPLAGDVAREAGARLHLALVLEPGMPDEFEGSSSSAAETGAGGEDDGERRRRAVGYLEELADGLQSERALRVTPVVLEGPVADALADYATGVGTQMVFMTTHGRSGLKRLLLGSVADAFVRSTTFPTVLIHPDCDAGAHENGSPGDIDHILVPLDGSDVAEDVLESACELAEALHARVTLTNVISIDSIFGPRPVKLLRFESDVTRARSYLETVASRLAARDLRVDVHATAGRAPAPAIAQIADELEADLIAVGTRGSRGLRRALEGSVAHRLLHVAHRPLLVAKGGSEP